jgi:hypothetical protein
MLTCEWWYTQPHSAIVRTKTDQHLSVDVATLIAVRGRREIFEPERVVSRAVTYRNARMETLFLDNQRYSSNEQRGR